MEVGVRKRRRRRRGGGGIKAVLEMEMYRRDGGGGPWGTEEGVIGGPIGDQVNVKGLSLK